ncbi:uncharacterized protein EMH_0052680 [Eimeria mitis]|uniref:ABC1 atypical kinase-like domain-containing protein n=1 Tax=Eimeria mitis TaxID=44415 RepID=U6KCL6_9EIME|nr:uncharacterized protein EMH_0052680 [Eimeria mitis]CDJ33228.1 hypothetical protein, conserved [Eimeria mitis]
MMLGRLSQANRATHNVYSSLPRFYHGGADTRRTSIGSNRDAMGSGSGGGIRHLLGRFKVPHRPIQHRKAASSLVAFGRGCCVAGAALTAAGLIGWGIQLVMPERSRTWAVLRCANAAATLAALSIDYKLLSWWDISGCHQRTARRLVRLAERNRGVYVKVGQHASAMEYLLPLEYTQQLQRLQCNLPPSPMAQVEEVLKQELKIERLDEVFREFDETPVGTASLAQVHFAVLANGQPVAVKVQHADVRQLAETDTRVVELLTAVAAKIFPDVRLEWLVDLLRENLPAELDFRKEAENANRCRELLQEGCSSFHFGLPQPSLLQSILIRLGARVASYFWLPNPHSQSGDNSGCQSAKTPPTRPSDVEGVEGNASLVTDKQSHSRTPQLHSRAAANSTVRRQEDYSHCLNDYEIELYVPRVYNKLTTARVLVMERCKGVPVDDLRGILSQGIHPLAVSEALSELYGRLIFDVGFVHADPHPGNVIVHLEKGSGSSEEPRQPRLLLRTPVVLSSLTGAQALNARRLSQESGQTKGRLRLSLLDHGLYCSLTERFRHTYASLWLAMQRGDIAAVTACANEFGVDELAGLLAVILSLRSEDREAELLRRSFPEYFTRITSVLQDIPHELILLIKTNDLLRAIQGRLGVDEALVLLPLLQRALTLVGKDELQELTQLQAPTLQSCDTSDGSLLHA